MSYQSTTLSSSSYYKSATDGLIAHIYEHIIAVQLDRYMKKHGLLAVIDYDLWANTYGKTCYIDVRLQHGNAKSVFEAAFQYINDAHLSEEMVQQAAIEISCEYQKPLTKHSDPLLEKLQSLHNEKWLSFQEFHSDIAEMNTSVNTLYENDLVRYSRSTPKSFTELAVQYSIPATVLKNSPLLKPLVMLIVQTAALNQLIALKDDILFYDAGDEWDAKEGITYTTYLRFPRKTHPTEAAVRNLLEKNTQRFVNEGFSQRLVDLVQTSYHNESAQYFDKLVINDITGGIIIGPAGWKEIATYDSAKQLFSEMTIGVTSEV